MSDIFIAFLVLRYIITCIEKDIIPIIHSSTEKLFVCKQASNFCLNTLEFISSVQLVGEVGENEGTHHLIEARARYVVSLYYTIYSLRSPRQMKKEGAPPQQLRDF